MNTFFPQDFYQNTISFSKDWTNKFMYSRIKKTDYASARKRILIDGETKEFWIGHYIVDDDNSFHLVESIWCVNERFDEIWYEFYHKGKTFKEIYDTYKQSQDIENIIEVYYYSPNEHKDLRK